MFGFILIQVDEETGKVDMNSGNWWKLDGFTPERSITGGCALAARKHDRESMASNAFHFDKNESILLYLFQIPFQHQPKYRCTQNFIDFINNVI